MPVSRRDPWLDNSKVLLVALVVVGHSFGLLAGTSLDRHLYDFVYCFHIPAFVLISGYLSRSFEWTRRRLWVLFTTIALPYLIFEPALYYFRLGMGGAPSGPPLVDPHWAMWYLPVLFFWRLGTPIFKRHPAMILVAVVISLLGGMLDWHVLCFSRVMGLLPFFVLGLHLGSGPVDLLKRSVVKPVAVAALVGIGWFAWHLDDYTRTAFFLYDTGYAELGEATPYSVQLRALALAVGLLGTLAVLALMPQGRRWFTPWGANTMVVYLFHGFVVKTILYRGWSEWTADHDVLAILTLVLGAGLLTVVLGSPPVARVFTWATDPVGSVERRRAARRAEAEQEEHVPAPL